MTIDEIRMLGIEGEYFGPGPYGGYRIQQFPEELAGLYQLLCWLNRDRPILRYLEVGLGSAGLFRFFCENLPIEFSFYVDDFAKDDFEPERSENMNIARQIARSEGFAGDSHSEGCRDFLRLVAGTGFDFVFLDGDHTAAGIEADTRMVLPHVRESGLVAFHDTLILRRRGVRCEVPHWIRRLDAGEIPELRLIAKFEKKLGIALYGKVTL